MGVSQISGLAADGYTGHQVTAIDLGGGLKALVVSLAGGVIPAPTGGGHTGLLVVTDVTPVAVTAVTQCSSINLVEDNSVPSWPTLPFVIRKPSSGSTANQYPAGSQYLFPAPFGTKWAAGQIVGYIQLPATGSTTFIQDESA